MTAVDDQTRSESEKEPSGILVAVGGNEDKKHNLFILRAITSLLRKENVKIEVITTASEVPEEVGKMYVKAFSKIGGNSLNLMHIKKRDEGEDPDFIRRIGEADIIFFTGGDQLRITSILGGSSILKEVRRKYFSEKCIIAGTSAGATAMSETMIYGGTSSEALLKGNVHFTAGMGLIDNVVIDSHFIKRGRFSRLMQLMSMNPGHLGIGLGEDTGIVIEKGHIIKAIGTGLVVIFDGQHIRSTNVTKIKDGEAIAIENVHVHTIVKGFGYDLRERKYLKPEDVECISLSCN
ncbi:MAG: cyanophycinase [Candidatus Thermoplasmatota archaeon]|nr:cyanophycinase [Candidatus Thermoplasmatota archaeon]